MNFHPHLVISVRSTFILGNWNGYSMLSQSQVSLALIRGVRMRDNATGRARGFAFVEMASDEDAQNAISQFNNYSFGGRNLTVNEARPKPQGTGGGFGGGRGGGRREPRW